MQPLKSIAPQWEAKDKKLRPCNPHLNHSEKYFNFEKGIWNFIFDTHLPDRIYNADELNEPAYQQRYIYGGEWHEPFLAKFCESYEMFQFEVDFDFETRQFVTLKQPTQTTI